MEGRNSEERGQEMEEIKKEDREQRREELNERLTPEMVEIQPFYYDIKNQIVKPKKVIVETRYFLDNWVPLLGPVLSLLIIKLRARCYWNPETGEKRNHCLISQETLAKSIGVSRSTVIRELKHPFASKFIRVEPRYRYDPELCRKVRTSNIYYVSMDDPIAPGDEKLLVSIAAERILKEEDERQAKKKVDDEKREKEKAQRNCVNKVTVDKGEKKEGTQVIENKEVPSKCQFDTQEAVSNCNIKKYLEDILKSVNVTNDFNISKEKNENNFEKVKAELLAQDLAKELEDKKSLGFYRKITRMCSHERLYAILSEVKLLYHEGRIKKSRGAAFTDMLKRSVSLA